MRNVCLPLRLACRPPGLRSAILAAAPTSLLEAVGAMMSGRLAPGRKKGKSPLAIESIDDCYTTRGDGVATNATSRFAPRVGRFRTDCPRADSCERLAEKISCVGTPIWKIDGPAVISRYLSRKEPGSGRLFRPSDVRGSIRNTGSGCARSDDELSSRRLFVCRFYDAGADTKLGTPSPATRAACARNEYAGANRSADALSHMYGQQRSSQIDRALISLFA
ncbi:hypothetical protein J2Z50_004723 [Ensifer mexicanus]|nr:hypothetical protein [Sinorhizobium mexicanum]